MTEKDLGLKYFKLQKQANELAEEQAEIKEEMVKRYKDGKFERLETMLGTVVPVAKIEYEFEDPAIEEEFNEYKLKIKQYDKEISQIKTQKKPFQDELKKIQKKGKAVKVYGANTSLRSTINK